jgi:hypothetical protein
MYLHTARKSLSIGLRVRCERMGIGMSLQARNSINEAVQPHALRHTHNVITCASQIVAGTYRPNCLVLCVA